MDFFVLHNGRLMVVKPSNTAPGATLPAELKTAVLADPSIRFQIAGASIQRDTHLMFDLRDGWIYCLRRIHKLPFTIPFQLLDRGIASLTAAGAKVMAGLPKGTDYVLVPDPLTPAFMNTTDGFVWDVPADMGLFFATRVRADGSALSRMPGSAESGKWFLIAINLTDGPAKMYRPVLPNVHGNMELCTGSPALVVDRNDLEGSFVSAYRQWATRPWNRDLLDDNSCLVMQQLIRGDAKTGKTLPPASDWKALLPRAGDPYAEGTGGADPLVHFTTLYAGAAKARAKAKLPL